MPEQVAFVGLGRMGLPMARNVIAAGWDVRGFDLAETAFDRQVDSLAEATAGAEVVVLMLPASDHVEAVVDQLDLEDGALILDMSSSEPARTRALSGRGVPLVDAPVSGGVRGAESATLSIMAGGSEEQFARVLPLLETMGSNVYHVGPVGAGHAVKALNNLLSATNTLIACEALLVGRRFGLEPQTMIEAWNGSSGRNSATEHKLPEFIIPERWGSGFPLELMVKDLRIARDLARQLESPLELGERTVELWEQGLAELPAGADQTEIARWQGRR